MEPRGGVWIRSPDPSRDAWLRVAAEFLANVRVGRKERRLDHVGVNLGSV